MNTMSVRTWIILIINSLVVVVVLFLSATFYSEFSSVLDERVMLHLNSIKTLKQIQLSKLINQHWDLFEKDTISEGFDMVLPKDLYKTSGIYDLTPLHPAGQTSIALIKVSEGQRKLRIIDYENIKNILLERTGMGSSGESYLVGSDYRLRSQSRFFPDKTPYTILARTKGVFDGIKGNTNTGVFPDYRGVPVYSAYQPLEIGNLKWVILSEIDVEEVTIPLRKMRHKLIILTICIIAVAVILSLFLTKVITSPILEMKRRLMVMTKGNYNYEELSVTKNARFAKKPIEITEMFEALGRLTTALSGAVDFSVDIGKMNLDSTYQPKSADDLLGHSLLKMRKKLIAFRNKEQQVNLTNKRILVERLEEERRRLARELHDGIGPLLTSLKFYIQNHIKQQTHREEIKKMIDTTITEVRAMTNALMPFTLEDFGIGATLNNYVQSIQQSVAIPIHFEDETREENSNISKEQAVNLFRIAQELINNTIKHADASQIRLTLSEFDDFVSLYYYDNGGGFDMKKVTFGSGIANIKERVEIFNGTIDIQSTKGTTIFEIELPIENKSYDTPSDRR